MHKKVTEMISGNAKKFWMVILAAIFIFAGIQLVTTLLEYKQGEDIYNNAAEEYAIGAVTEAAVLVSPIEIDFKALYALNEDIVGWIWINDLKINYPLVRGDDNQYYLTHTYDGTYNSLGSIFMDFRNSKELDDPNTLIYGHNMLTDEMFGILEKYADLEFYEKHKYVYVLQEDIVKKYEIFSAYVTDAYGDSYTREFSDTASFNDFLFKMKDQSLIETGVPITKEDKIITLSTCTSHGGKTERFVVQAKQVFE